MGGGEVIKKGWLIKSPPLEGGGIKTWRKRYFKLRTSKVLEYYKSDDGELLKGVINLEDCKTVHSDLSHKKYKYVFDIETRDRTYYLVAQTKEEMKAWVSELCHICGLTVQDDEELPSVPLELMTTTLESSSSGPSISAPLYATAPPRMGGVAFNERFKPSEGAGVDSVYSLGGVAFNERFKPSEGAGMESVYSLAHAAENDVQRQLNGGQRDVAAGTPLAEALAIKGISSGGTRSSSMSSASGGDASTSRTSDPIFFSPPHEVSSTEESSQQGDSGAHNLYTPTPGSRNTSNPLLSKPVPKPRSATLNPRATESSAQQDFTSSLVNSSPSATSGRAELMDNGYMRPRQAAAAITRPPNYDHLPPSLPRPATNSQTATTPPSKHHRSALLSDPLQQGVNPTYINVPKVADDLPPVVNRSNKPPEPTPPKVDRKLKPDSPHNSPKIDRKPNSQPDLTPWTDKDLPRIDRGNKPKNQSESSLHRHDSDESPPACPTRTTSLAPTSLTNKTQSDNSLHCDRLSESPPPQFPTRTTSLGNTLEQEGEVVMDANDIPRPTRRTMKYTEVKFDPKTQTPELTEPGATTGPSSEVQRTTPVPKPRGRVNYSDVDLTATSALANSSKKREANLTLREAEREALKDKPYINVDREGKVDEDTDPGYYTHMRNLTYEEALEAYNIDNSDDEDG